MEDYGIMGMGAGSEDLLDLCARVLAEPARKEEEPNSKGKYLGYEIHVSDIEFYTSVRKEFDELWSMDSATAKIEGQFCPRVRNLVSSRASSRAYKLRSRRCKLANMAASFLPAIETIMCTPEIVL